ncbi:MAG TPA: hypothetical protein VFB72_11190 [Verrucomicrobiae bacterium]|nr:hypothetical protein [Verrucomicrobiae bacterium]
MAPTFWEQHGWHVIAGAAFCLALIALIIFWLRRPKIVIAEPPATAARRALESWRNRAEDGALVADVTRVVRRYVVCAFNLPSEELTTTEFRKALLSDPHIPRDVGAAAGDFLRRCDQWKFAPAPPAPPLEAVAFALELINKMEAARAPVPANTQ